MTVLLHRSPRRLVPSGKTPTLPEPAWRPAINGDTTSPSVAEGSDAFNLASMNLPAGGQKYPNEAAQLMTAIPQFTPAVDNEVKRFCK